MVKLKDHVWSCNTVQRVKDIVLHSISHVDYGESEGLIETMAAKVEMQASLLSELVEHLYANEKITMKQLGELVGNPELREVDR
jgi:hypothetical protein